MNRFAGLLCLTLIITGNAAAADKFPRDTLVVSQGTARLTLGDVDGFVQKIPEKDRANFMYSSKRVETMLTNLLTNQQLANEARELHIDQDPVVQAQIRVAIDDILAGQRLVRLTSEIKVPHLEQLAKEEYQAAKTSYRTPLRVDVEHVLVGTKSRSDAEAQKIISEVEREAKANPSQFQTLVEKYSDDGSKTNNKGLMTDASSPRYDPAFAGAASELKTVGEISPVVKSSFGYHVLKLVKRTEGKQLAYDEVRQQILDKLTANYIAKQRQDHMDELRNRKMDADPDAVASLRMRYLPEGMVLPESDPVKPQTRVDDENNGK